MRIVNPKVNYLVEPFIDREPSISWQLEGDKRGQAQAAYRITVAEKDTGACAYDTGWVESSDCTNILLNMKPAALTPYTFTIEAKDNEGGEAEKCVSSFTGGKMGEKFTAKWINCVCARRRMDVMGAVYLRKVFKAPAKLKRALLVICGLGYFEASLNGKQVGDEFLSTPYTAYDLNTQYRIFDVTDMLNEGDNAIGVKLGNSYYNYIGNCNWNTHTAPWRDSTKLLCELHMVDEDGNDTLMVSDNTWKGSYGPIVFNSIKHGEFYDARLEMDGWDTVDFDESKYDGAYDLQLTGRPNPIKMDMKWQDTYYVRLPGGKMTVMEMEPIRVLRKFHPVKKWKGKNGWMFDIGVGQAGIANITYHGKAGDTIEVRYSDFLDDNKDLDQSMVNGFIRDFKFQTDNYTKRTDEPETWHPIFTFHGFQYMEISGTDWEPEIEDIEIWSLGNDLPVRGHFTCSDDIVNQIQQLALNSLRSVCFSVLNCDTAREKICWTGDTGLSTQAMMINFAADAFFTKQVRDIRDAQKPSGLLPCIIPTAGWGYTFANGADWSQPLHGIPHSIYQQAKDIRILKDNYEAMKRFVSYLEGMSVNGIVAAGLGDWCAPFDGPAISVNMSSFKCPMPLTDTTFYYEAILNTIEAAKVLGYTEDLAWLEGLKEYTREAFRREFFDAEACAVRFPDRNDPSVISDCQTATVCMIAFGFANDDEIPGLIKDLHRQILRDNDHLDVGVLGMRALVTTLGNTGNAQWAADLLTRDDYPSMKHWIDMGATTLWECWNGGGSHNHNMYSCVSEFFYKYIAGIRSAAPGYDKIVFEPMLNGHTDSAKASIDATRGLIATEWAKTETGFTVKVTVPVSCEAELLLPAEYNGKCVKCALTESGKPASETLAIGEWERGVSVALTSGEWCFAL